MKVVAAVEEPLALYLKALGTVTPLKTVTVRSRVDFNDGGPFRASITGDFYKQDNNQIANTILATTEGVPGPFAGLAANNIPGTALDVVTGASGFLFAGLYNFCIGASAADLAARNAANLCGARHTVNGYDTSSPLADPTLGGVNQAGNPAPNLLPYDSRFITGDIDTSYAAWRLKTPIPYSIRAVTKVRAAKLSMPHWVKFLERHAAIKNAFEFEIMKLMSEVMAHTITLHLLDAPGRLSRFQRKHPELVGRIPKKELAAYLNLTPETLSRLKQKLG